MKNYPKLHNSFRSLYEEFTENRQKARAKIIFTALIIGFCVFFYVLEKIVLT